MDIISDQPDRDQLEVILLGPGHGECVLIHIGSGHWIIIDSCIDSISGQPAALKCLDDMGVDSGEAVRLIIVTHWHDDHIRGMSEVVRNCPNADFCLSSALGTEEFIAMTIAYDAPHTGSMSSGAREIHQVMHELKKLKKIVKTAGPDRPIYRLEPARSGHGHECRVTTLSPSDAQIDKFRFEIAGSMPEISTTRRRCTPQAPNHLAVVVWIEIGPVSLLFGADLEETRDLNTGWSTIINSNTKPQGKASIFKIPHHGSENAHNEDVWNQMLIKSPIAILTPYRKSKLPKPTDRDRILLFTPEAYSTTKVTASRAPGRSQAVDKTLREMGVTITRAEPRTGMLRLRNDGKQDFEKWKIELSESACHLSEAI